MATYELLEDRAGSFRVLVSGLENWIDAGGAARRAASILAGGSPDQAPDDSEGLDDFEPVDEGAEEPVDDAPTTEARSASGEAVAEDRTAPTAPLLHLAAFDADELVDHQARRPTMELVDGVNTGLTLPHLDLYGASDPGGTPFLLLQGPEPDHRWRAFSADVVSLARRFDVQLVVSLGAYPAPVPHTRTCRVVATATSDALAGRVGFLPGRMEVPASINAMLERACADAGLDAVGLWAQVPHYVSNFPFPAGTVALLDALADLTGLRFPTGGLEAAAARTRQRIDDLVAQNPEHAAMVRQLEQMADELPTPGPLPSADELAAELEHFLRGQPGADG